MKRKTRKLLRSLLTLAVLAVGVAYAAINYPNELNAFLDESGVPAVFRIPVGQKANTNIDVQGLEIPEMQVRRPEQVIKHLGYTVSYNPNWNIPNWVAYELSADEVDGVEERSNHFKPDPLVVGDPVVTKDYSNSGYDRGHMAPAADFKWSEQAMQESFYMTNMCPQCHNLNAGDWKVLEERVRSLAKQYQHIYVCCGPLVYDTNTTIGTARKIVVPQAFFKAIMLNDGKQWSGVGFVFNNKPKDGKYGLEHYEMTINELEAIAEMDLFPNLPDDVEELVESVIGKY